MRFFLAFFSLQLAACSDQGLAKLNHPEPVGSEPADEVTAVPADTASPGGDTGSPADEDDTGAPVDSGTPDDDTTPVDEDDDPLEAPAGLRWCTDVSLECLVYCVPGTQEANPSLDLECALALDPCSSDRGWAALWFSTPEGEAVVQGLLASEQVYATCLASGEAGEARFDTAFDQMDRTDHPTQAGAGWIWVSVDTATTPVPELE